MERDDFIQYRTRRHGAHQPSTTSGLMKIAILKESAPGETRCAAIPETVKKVTALGAEVAVESGAGDNALISNEEFEAAGAKTGSRAEVLKGAGAILCVM